MLFMEKLFITVFIIPFVLEPKQSVQRYVGSTTILVKVLEPLPLPKECKAAARSQSKEPFRRGIG